VKLKFYFSCDIGFFAEGLAPTEESEYRLIPIKERASLFCVFSNEEWMSALTEGFGVLTSNGLAFLSLCLKMLPDFPDLKLPPLFIRGLSYSSLIYLSLHS
jgi:hypothetical protein